MATRNKPSVHVERRFGVSRERVFEAWLKPDLLGRWMFGLREEDVIRSTVDARVGGSFSFVVRRQGVEIEHAGRYLHMNRPSRLVFTWGIGGVPDESRVTVDLLPAGAGCELMLSHELSPGWADHAARTEAGWIRVLAALASSLGDSTL